MAPEIGDTFGIDDGDVIVIATLVAIAAVAAVLPDRRTSPTGSTASGSWRSPPCRGWP